jgi:hypothetical protein
VVTDATKKLREPVAYILLAFAGLLALASLIRLFVGGAGFTAAAGGVQGTLTPPAVSALVLLAALVAAVWLVTEAGERTPNARTVTLAALFITGLLALLALITAFAGFNETSTPGLKLVSFIYALGGLALYGAVGIYVLRTFQALPAPVRAPKAAPHGQFAGQGGQYGMQGGGQGGVQGGQYGQPGAQYGQQGQYGQYGAPGQYGQQEGQYGAYGAGPAAGAAGGYAAAQQGGEQWPQEQGWNQEGQPAEQTWSAEGHNAEPTQAWSADAGQQQWGGQDQAQQWPQEQQQWGGHDQAQQWAGQEQYPQQSAETPAPQGEQAWAQPEWPQGEQTWQGDDAAAPAAAPAAAAEPEPEPEAAADETRVEPRASEDEKDDESQQQQGQSGQQGWWSQPS